MKEVKCNQCGWEGDAEECKPCFSAYHDLRCPGCRSTNLDTSELNKRWKAAGQEYGYGNHNVLGTLG